MWQEGVSLITSLKGISLIRRPSESEKFKKPGGVKFKVYKAKINQCRK